LALSKSFTILCQAFLDHLSYFIDTRIFWRNILEMWHLICNISQSATNKCNIFDGIFILLSVTAVYPRDSRAESVAKKYPKSVTNWTKKMKITFDYWSTTLLRMLMKSGLVRSRLLQSKCHVTLFIAPCMPNTQNSRSRW